MIYSPHCDNPNTMIILDPTTNKVYTQQEAEQQPKEIKKRLVNRCLKQGYNVLTIEEADKLLEERRKNY